MTRETESSIETFHDLVGDCYDTLYKLQKFMSSPAFKNAYVKWKKQEDPDSHLFETFREFLDDLPDAMH